MRANVWTITIGLCAGALLFGAATVNQIKTQYALKGDAGLTLGPIVLDPSITLSRVGSTAHMGVNFPPSGTTVTLDGTVIGTRQSINITSGQNVRVAASDTGSAISLQISAPSFCVYSVITQALVGCAQAQVFGQGFTVTPPSTDPSCTGPCPQVAKVDIDPSWTMQRVDPPAGGPVQGPCLIGKSSYMIDAAGYEYKCFPTAGDPTVYELRRSPQAWVNVW